MGRRALSLFTVFIALSTASAMSDPVTRVPGAVPLMVNPEHRPGDELPDDPAGAIRATRQKIAAGDMTGAIRSLSAYVFNHPRRRRSEALPW